MHRLFIAIRPPAPIRAQLLRIMHGVRGVRWQTDEQLHLTLRFVGEVDRHRAEDVAAALGGIHHPSFMIALSGIGRFDRRGKGALWAGVTPHDQLHQLHKKIDQACLRVGIAPDTRAFHPHITLARFSHGSGPIDALVERQDYPAGDTFLAESFSLFESELSASGAVYSIVERYRLI